MKSHLYISPQPPSSRKPVIALCGATVVKPEFSLTYEGNMWGVAAARIVFNNLRGCSKCRKEFAETRETYDKVSFLAEVREAESVLHAE